MYFLEPDGVLSIHDKIIREDPNAAPGVLYRATIYECCAKVRGNYYGFISPRDIFSKAALLMYCLIYNSPFNDGNKRTGWIATRHFLEMNGIILYASPVQVRKFTLKIANGEISLLKIRDWIKSHSSSVLYRI